MTQADFLRKHGGDEFAFHKIDKHKIITYTNTVMGISVKGSIKFHSNLESVEDGHTLMAELEELEILILKPIKD